MQPKINVDLIQIHDKTFEPYLSKEQINQAIENIADALNDEYRNKKPVVLAVLNGSFMFCSDLVKNLSCQPEIHFIKVASFDGMQSSGNVKTMIGLPISLKGRDVIVVEDIVDTGHTMDELESIMNKEEVNSFKIATLLFKPTAFLGKNIPTFVGIEIPNEFVVGFGLDYDGLGREIPEIYKIKL